MRILLHHLQYIPHGDCRDHRSEQPNACLELHWIDGDRRTQTPQCYIASGRQSAGDGRKQRNRECERCTAHSSVRKRVVGPCNRDLDNNGKRKKGSSVPLNRSVAARRARFSSGRRAGNSLGRNIFASLSIPRFPPNYHLSPHDRCVRAVVFRGHAQREHLKCRTDTASFCDTWF
jgi:hypothetical protein